MGEASEQPNQGTKPWMSQTLAVGVVIAFLLPFVTVSCEGHEVASIAGVQFAIGGPIEISDGVSDSGDEENVDIEPWATAGILLAIASAIIAFVPKRWRTGALFLLGIGGAVSLVLLRVTLETEFGELRSAGAVVTYTWGWWLAVAGFSGLVVVNGVSDPIGSMSQDTDHDKIVDGPVGSFLRLKDPPGPDPPAGGQERGRDQGVFNFCRACGTRFSTDDRFCGSCGAARGGS